MIPSKAIAAVASSALRNYRQIRISDNETFVEAERQFYLDKRIIFFVVALDCQNGVSGSTCADAHFDHLAIEEVSQVLFINIGSDAANVETTGLTGQIWITTNTHAETLDR
jgi:hypothetical protein